MTKVTVAFPNFANALNNEYNFEHRPSFPGFLKHKISEHEYVPVTEYKISYSVSAPRNRLKKMDNIQKNAHLHVPTSVETCKPC